MKSIKFFFKRSLAVVLALATIASYCDLASNNTVSAGLFGWWKSKKNTTEYRTDPKRYTENLEAHKKKAGLTEDIINDLNSLSIDQIKKNSINVKNNILKFAGFELSRSLYENLVKILREQTGINIEKFANLIEALRDQNLQKIPVAFIDCAEDIFKSYANEEQQTSYEYVKLLVRFLRAILPGAVERIDEYFKSIPYRMGQCGNNVVFILYCDGRLDIVHRYPPEGEKVDPQFADLKDGEMPDFSFNDKRLPGWHEKSDFINKITIYPGVINIGNNAFADSDKSEVKSPCTNSHGLKQLIINSDLERIGEYAFFGCESLEYADLSRVKNIEFGAFRNCTKLKNIVLDGANRLEYIGPCAFERTSVEYVTLPRSTKKVCENAFITSTLRKLYIPIENYDKLETGCSYAVLSNSEVLTSYHPSKRPALHNFYVDYCFGEGRFKDKKQDRFYKNQITNIYAPPAKHYPIRFSNLETTGIFDTPDAIKTQVGRKICGADPINEISVNCEPIDDAYLIKSDNFYLDGFKDPSHLEILADEEMKEGQSFKVGFLFYKPKTNKICAAELTLIFANGQHANKINNKSTAVPNNKKNNNNNSKFNNLKHTKLPLPFYIKVVSECLHPRKGPGLEYDMVDKPTGAYTFTIVEVQSDKTSDIVWGKLKSCAGWIPLFEDSIEVIPFIVKINNNNVFYYKESTLDSATKLTGKGSFTIIELKPDKNPNRVWGRLKSRAGWILFDCETK